MKCPFCDAQDTRVLDSRLSSDQEQIRRRRSCNICHERFNTIETLVAQWPRIIKRDGRREPFLDHKMRAGILRAFEKRPVSTEEIESLVSSLKKKLLSHPDRELPSEVLGEWILEGLKQIDELAFLRFASIYKRLKTAKELLEFLKTLHYCS